MDINGTAAVVSGGASGLGEATVRRLTAAGAVCTVFDRDAEQAEALARELGGATRFVAGDVTSPEDVTKAVETAADAGPLRIAVSCAGIGWAAMAGLDPLADGERGLVVNTASVAAFEGQVGQIAYSASKGGIVGMTVPAARDLAPAGIRVMTIAPGLMDTPLLGQLPDEVRQALGQSVLFPKRLGVPDEYAKLVGQFAENGYLNGEVVRLDGGLRMQPK
jgi:NAD(P)-dependent dehydrogenase (short-subunit alcohol dehydrogenase family)